MKPGTPMALEESCVVAARLTLEHLLSLLRSLGFASHLLRWYAFFYCRRALCSPALSTVQSVAER